MTGAHLVAFLGELVLWGCAGWAGWSLADGALRWAVSAGFVVAIIGRWSIWAAPRAVRRLGLWPRLALIGGLGAAVAAVFVAIGGWWGLAVTLASTVAILFAQWVDARDQRPVDRP